MPLPSNIGQNQRKRLEFQRKKTEEAEGRDAKSLTHKIKDDRENVRMDVLDQIERDESLSNRIEKQTPSRNPHPDDVNYKLAKRRGLAPRRYTGYDIIRSSLPDDRIVRNMYDTHSIVTNRSKVFDDAARVAKRTGHATAGRRRKHRKTRKHKKTHRRR